MTLLEFLKFEDWISKREFEDKAWIVVARLTIKAGDTDLFTTSALAKATSKDKLQQILSKPDWETPLEFGRPRFVRGIRSERISLELGTAERINGILFEPFTIHRQFHGIQPPRFEVVQNFFLYHNLYPAAGESVYRKLNADGEEFDVIAVQQTREGYEVKVKAKFLREYLAARRMILVRQHDHRRFSQQSLESVV